MGLVAPGSVMPEFAHVCEEAARAGGQVLLERWESFQYRQKAPKDLVTEADVASQEAIRRVVLGRFPQHSFLAEEGADIRGTEGSYRWIVDPLDGTANYVHRVPEFTVSVALEHDGELIAGAVYNPVSRESFTAARGKGAFLDGRPIRVSQVRDIADAMVAASFAAGVQRGSPEIGNFVNVLLASQSLRRTGSAALNLAYVAAGRYDAYWATSTKAWDIAAGVLLVREAGGVVTAPDGGPLDLAAAQFIAAANQPLHDAMRRLLS
jgi:myo-inositol-1(or 4)-monophosphatase